MKAEQAYEDGTPLISGAWRTNPRDAGHAFDEAAAILGALPVAVVVYDADARIRYVNPRGLAGAKLELQDVVGKRDEEVFPAHVVDSYRPYLERAFTTRQPVSAECIVAAKLGANETEVTFSVNYTPVLGPSGELESIMAVATDLTQQRRLEREALQFKAVQASLGYAWMTIALDGTVLNFSRGAENAYGFHADEVIGKHITYLCEPDSKAELNELIRRAATGELVEYEGRRRRKQGGVLELSLTLSPVRNDIGAVIALTELGRDISQRRELERRLLGIKHLETVSRAVAGISHDLNNVLTVISTYSGLIGQGLLSSEQRRDLTMAERAARRGAGLVGQLIALHQGQQRTRMVDLSAVLSDIQESLPRLFGETPTITARPSSQRLVVRSDVHKAQQLILALVEYAGALFPAGASRLLLTEPAPRGGSPDTPIVEGRICIRVDETRDRRLVEAASPGLDRSSAERLIRDVVEELGGRLEVELAARALKQIIVVLPLAEPVAVAEPSKPSRNAADAGVVLVAEDDAAIREAMRRVLSSAGFRVLLASSGSEAERVAREHRGPIHVMVTDQRMPSGDGLEAIARVRALRPQTRAILVSGHPDAELLPDDVQFLGKPFANEALTGMVERATAEFARSPNEAPPLDRPVVLVVDDDGAVRDSMTRLMAECRLAAVTAPSGLHALQILGSQRIDLVVADQLMPGMDGVQLLEVVRDRWPETGRVLFTAYPSSDVVLKAINHGGVHKVLVKSMHPLQIRNEIEASALEAARRRA